MESSLYCSILSTAMLFASGCGKEAPSVVDKLNPVAIQVTMKGEPLTSATVTLFPESGEADALSASAVTGEHGTCEPVSAIPGVSLNRSRGMVAGKYKVTISKLAMPDGSILPPETTDADAMEKGAKESIPAKFSNYDRTTLNTEITSESNVLTFELSK